VIDGGPGEDVLDNDWVDAEAKASAPVTLTLDGRADDGRPGEGDNVTSIERFKVYSGGTFTGTDGPDQYEIEPGEFRTPATCRVAAATTGWSATTTSRRSTAARATTTSRAASTTTRSPAVPARHDLRRRDRRVLQLRDVLPPAVRQRHDRRPRRRGRHRRLRHRTDTVKADPVDVLSNCETVDGGVAKPVTPAVPDDRRWASGPNDGRLGLTVAGAGLRAALRRGLTVQVAAPGPGTVAASVLRGSRTVGRGSAKATAAGAKTIRVRFTKAGRRALRRARTARLTVVVRFTPKQGPAVSERRQVTLRR
jgi:hypothetical protein